MVVVKKLVLDVLKPHIPNVLEMAKAIAEQGENYQVNIDVEEVDEKTETVVMVIQADNINFEAVENTINSLGGSLHSIDQVEVINGIASS